MIRAKLTSANCVAVSSIPFAPPSRRLTETTQKGEGQNLNKHTKLIK